MSTHFKAVSIALAVLLVIALGTFFRSCEKEVWITTTPDAFVSAAISSPAPLEKVKVGITPAPWPKEAGEILRAAKRGHIVHVTLVSKTSTDRFDIVGMSDDGELLIDAKSTEESKRINALLRGERTGTPARTSQ